MIEIPVQLESIDQLFEGFDPSPPASRRLSGELVAYLLSSLKSATSEGPVVITFLIPQGAKNQAEQAMLSAAITAHFRRLIAVATSDIKRIRLIGRVFIPIGLVIMCLCMLISNWLTEGNDRHVRHSIGEGILVLGWVALWAPFEHLLFGRLPVMRERSYYRQLAGAQVRIQSKP